MPATLLKKMKRNKIAHWIIYLAAAVVSVLSVVQSQKNLLPDFIGIVVYILAAISLTMAGICLYKDVIKGAAGRVLMLGKKTVFGAHFLEGYRFRTVLTTLPSFVINVVYTIYNGVIGVLNQSSWFIAMAVYYSLLGLMRYQAVNTERKISKMEDQKRIREAELAVIKIDGLLLLVLNLALSGVVLLTIAKGRARSYPDIIAISIAAYTFYKITMAVINMVKVRKMQSPILITIRNIGVADALVSMLTLQMTMLASFQETGSLDADRMNGMTGMAVCVLIAALGISMIYYARKRKESPGL